MGEEKARGEIKKAQREEVKELLCPNFVKGHLAQRLLQETFCHIKCSLRVPSSIILRPSMKTLSFGSGISNCVFSQKCFFVCSFIML